MYRPSDIRLAISLLTRAPCWQCLCWRASVSFAVQLRRTQQPLVSLFFHHATHLVLFLLTHAAAKLCVGLSVSNSISVRVPVF